MSANPTLDESKLAVVRAYHQRTKHRFDGYARGPEALNWDDQPAPFRRFEGAPFVALPRLSAVEPGSALHAALHRPFAGLASGAVSLPPGLAMLGALLQLSLGITAWKSFGPERWALRANPSSGNLHPVEAYLVVSGIAGLADGVHHYRPDDHALELRAAHALPAAAAAAGPRLGVVFTSVMWREAWKYGERAFRYCQLDTGHAVGALRYAAAVLGWRVVEQAQIGSTTLARLTGGDRVQDFPGGRQSEVELEEAELLLSVGFDGAVVPAFSSDELNALAAGAVWNGMASAVDRHPMFRWPAIAEVAEATCSDDGAAPPAATAVPAAARSATTNSFAATPVQQLINGRRSAQRFDGRHVMTLADFAALMERLQPDGGLPWDVSAAEPRAALAVFVHRVAGLTPGLYLLPRTPRLAAALRPALAAGYFPQAVDGCSGLLFLAAVAPVEWQRIARSLHCHQDIASNACFALGMLCEFDAALAGGPAAYRALYREAGLIGQVLYLEAEAHGLRGTGIGCFFDDPVHAVLGLEGTAWQTLYHFTVGRPIEDTRIETGPAYPDDAITESPP